MKSHFQNNGELRSKFDIIAVLIAFLTACALIAGFYSKMLLHPHSMKWTAAIILGLVAVFSSLVFIGKIRELVFSLSILTLSIKLDVFLYRQETPYIQQHGLVLSLFTILFAFLFLEWLIRIIRGQAAVKFYPEISIPVLIAILVAGLSIFNSDYKFLGISSLVIFVHCYLVFIYFANNFNEKMIKTILLMMMLSVMLQSLIGILQYGSGSTLGLDILGESEKSFRIQTTGAFMLSRVGGTLGSPNGLAIFLNQFLPVIICSVFMKIDSRIKMLAVITACMGLVTELLTLSRGGWVALAGSLYIALLVILKHRFKSYFKSIVFTTVLIAVSSVSVILLSSNVQQRLFEDNYKGPMGRIYQIQVAANVIKHNPLLGVGLNSYTTVMNRYDNTVVGISYSFPFPVHNAYFLLAAECGVFALLAIMVLWLNVFLKSRVFAQFNDGFLTLFGTGILCGTISWFIQSQFEPFPVTATNTLWFNFALLAAVAVKLNEKRTDAGRAAHAAGEGKYLSNWSGETRE